MIKKLILLILVAQFFACKNDSPNETSETKLRVIHGVPDAGSLQILLNGTIVSTISSYALTSTYVTAKEGTNLVQFKSSSTGQIIYESSINLSKERYYTFYLTDSLNKMKESLSQDIPYPSEIGTSFQVLHLGTVVPGVDFTFQSESSPFSPNRSFNDQATNFTVASFYQVNPFNKTIEARLTGTDSVLTSITQNFQAGKSYTLILRNPVSTQAASFTLIEN